MAENFNNNSQPNKLATEVNQHIKQKTNCRDAYFKQKEVSNEIALSVMDKVKDTLKQMMIWKVMLRCQSLEIYLILGFMA